MSEIRERTIMLSPVRVKYTDGNPIPFSAVPKRKATTKEALYILKNILGFDLDLSFNDVDTKKERDDLKQEFTEALNGFLDGGDWGSLCDACYCYDDVEVVNYACFLWMVSYCLERGIL